MLSKKTGQVELAILLVGIVLLGLFIGLIIKEKMASMQKDAVEVLPSGLIPAQE